MAEERSQAHKPVLLAEVLALIPEKARLAIDCTVGGAGHAREVLKRLGREGKLIGFDRDIVALKIARENLQEYSHRIELIHDSYANIDRHLDASLGNSTDFVFFDLGLSSLQLEDSGRGFSFRNPDEPLDMRFDCDSGEPLSVKLQETSEDALTGVLREFGEVDRARPLARSMIRASQEGKLSTTGDLSRLVMDQFRGGKSKQLLAKVWQALRIWVNDELGQLQAGMEKVVAHLGPGGVIAVISFHSLEDRFVKNFFARREDPCVCPKSFPKCVCGAIPTLERVTRKALKPSTAEIETNPRARSARLRAARRLAAI